MSMSYGPDWLPPTSSAETIVMRYRPANLFVDFLIVDNVTLFVNGEPPTHLPFPDDFAAYLQSNSYFSDVTPTIPVSLRGATGYQVDAIGKTSSSDRVGFLNFDTMPFKEFVYPEPQKYRFLYFEDISGKRFLIVVGTDDGGKESSRPLTNSEFDALMPKVQEVLDTVTFNQ